MKTKFSVLGMLALIFVVISAGCDNGNDPTPPTPPSSPTPLTPVEIRSLAELMAIDDNTANLRKNYKLMADITGPVTTPIGKASGKNLAPFTGDFDGNGYAITLNITSGLTVSGGDLDGTYGGLFAGIGGSVHDLKVTGTVNITTTTGKVYVGGIAGGMAPGTSISNVESSVVVTGSGNDDVHAGGVVGTSEQGTVSKAFATGNVSASSGSEGVCAGGVVGVSKQGTVENASATGDVSAVTNANEGAQAGGVVGASQEGTVRNVYATGNISATSNGGSMGVGGVVGSCKGGTVSYAYATGSVSATAQGAGPGENDDSVTVCASGIVGGSNPGPVIRYTVALNSAVSATGTNYKKPSHRIISTPDGIVTTNGAANYGKEGLIPIGSSTGSPAGGTTQNGADVTVTGGPPPYTAPSQSWWTDTGFSGADWTNVWKWDGTSGLPVLR